MGFVPIVIAGAASPESIKVRWNRMDPLFDTANVVDGALVISGPGYTKKSLAATVIDRGVDYVVVEHVWKSDGTDVPDPTILRVKTVLNISGGGIRRGMPFTLEVSE